MKTLRLFFATMLVLLLTVGISGAKSNKTVVTGSSGIGTFQFDCVNEWITGELSWVLTMRNGIPVQWRYQGTYTGNISGKNYTLISVENTFSMKNYVEGKAYNNTQITTAVIECEGVPIAIFKFRYHFTVNACGETVVFFDRYIDWVCLEI